MLTFFKALKKPKHFRERNNLWWIMLFFQHDPESKRQSMHWKGPSSPRQKKARQRKSKFKIMMIFFFFSTFEGLFTWIWCLKVRPLIRSTTRRFLTNLRKRVRRRRPEMWKNGSWVLHRDNAPALNALSVKMFLTKHKITLVEHPLYSPGLAPCDFFYFQRPSLR